jgi:uncharacterized OsmC-like protein
MLEYRISAKRIDDHGGEARCKQARVRLDTDPAGREDAFNPAELLMAAFAACILKGIERVAPMLKFEFRNVEVHIRGVREEPPPRFTHLEYDLIVDTDEAERRLELLHKNVRSYGTVYNTLASALEVRGSIRRNGPAADEEA